MFWFSQLQIDLAFKKTFLVKQFKSFTFEEPNIHKDILPEYDIQPHLIPEILLKIYLSAYMCVLYLVQQKLPIKKLHCQGFSELVKDA